VVIDGCSLGTVHWTGAEPWNWFLWCVLDNRKNGNMGRFFC